MQTGRTGFSILQKKAVRQHQRVSRGRRMQTPLRPALTMQLTSTFYFSFYLYLFPFFSLFPNYLLLVLIFALLIPESLNSCCCVAVHICTMPRRIGIRRTVHRHIISSLLPPLLSHLFYIFTQFIFLLFLFPILFSFSLSKFLNARTLTRLRLLGGCLRLQCEIAHYILSRFLASYLAFKNKTQKK